MKRILFLMVCIILVLSFQARADNFDYNNYPQKHYKNKDTLTKIKQVLADANNSEAFGIKLNRYNEWTGNQTEKVFIYNLDSVQKHSDRQYQLYTADQYLLNPNQTEYKEARIIYKTIQFKTSLAAVVNTIQTTVVDANCIDQINIMRDAGYADLDTLKEGAEGNYLTALNSIRAYIGQLTTTLKTVTDSEIISKIVQYKSLMATKIGEAVSYDSAHIVQYNDFLTGHNIDIDILDQWADNKIVLMASVVVLRDTLNTAIDFNKELLDTELTTAISSMEGGIISNIDSFGAVNYSSIKDALVNLVTAYEATL